MKNIFTLKNKVAVVTGGYGYLGCAISFGLAEAGAKVYLTGDDRRKLKTVLNSDHKNNLEIGFLDLRSLNSIKKSLEKIWNKEGKINIVINNAVYGKVGSLDLTNELEWSEGLDGTVGGVFRVTKSALPFLQKSKGSSIINISSMYGIVSPDPSIYDNTTKVSPPSYGVGKAGIIQFTKYAACHFGKLGIRVNCISPGPFPDPKINNSPKFIENLKKKNPLGRIGKPPDIVGTVIFLASDASSFITGQNICIDGGRTAW